jgi:hypothetical protein
MYFALFFFSRFIGVCVLAHVAPGLAAVLAESAVGAGVLFQDYDFSLHTCFKYKPL